MNMGDVRHQNNCNLGYVYISNITVLSCKPPYQKLFIYNIKKHDLRLFQLDACILG